MILGKDQNLTSDTTTSLMARLPFHDAVLTKKKLELMIAFTFRAATTRVTLSQEVQAVDFVQQ